MTAARLLVWLRKCIHHRALTCMSGTAGNDASQSASTEVSGGIELNAAFARFAAAGHLGGSFFGCHCAALLDWSLMELEKSTNELVECLGGPMTYVHKKWLEGLLL